LVNDPVSATSANGDEGIGKVRHTRCHVRIRLITTRGKIMDEPNKPIWEKKYEAGCEWCGRKTPGTPEHPSLPYKRYGLDFCHIISRANGPKQEWNGFVLCPTCHRLFDEVVKPKIINALETAVCGFPEIPTKPKRRYISATSYKEAIELMAHRERQLAAPARRLKRWQKKGTTD